MLFSESLKKNDDFRNVYKKGRSVADGRIVLCYISNGTDRNRLGISVSKKTGNSVVRHRFARLVREAYRLHESMFTGGVDMVVVARACAGSATYHEVCDSLLSLAKRARLLGSDAPQLRCGGDGTDVSCGKGRA